MLCEERYELSRRHLPHLIKDLRKRSIQIARDHPPNYVTSVPLDDTASLPRRYVVFFEVSRDNKRKGRLILQVQSGYVIERWGNLRIDGWRKSLDTVATFYFTRLPDSYAARTGRPDDVGVIGVALFREQGRRHCCMHMDESRAEGAAEATAPRSAQSADRERAESKLGTGHGHQEASAAQYVDFERASSAPDETLVIYYDSRRNLVAQGVLPPASRVGKHRPDPFPAGFAPDPPN